MYYDIKTGSYDISFFKEIYLNEGENKKFVYGDIILNDLDCEISLEGKISMDVNGEYSDIEASGVVIFYTKEFEEKSRIYVDYRNFHKVKNSLEKSYNIDLIGCIMDQTDFSGHTKYPTAMSDKL